MNKDKGKKPLVNWGKREKEVSYSTRKEGNKEITVKTKTVKAPESVLSKGFTKVVTKEKVETPYTKTQANKRIAIGTALAIGSMFASDKLQRTYQDQSPRPNKSTTPIQTGKAFALGVGGMAASIPLFGRENKKDVKRVVTKVKNPRK